ncbi:MAG: ABC transporter permease [Nitrospirae bacterium]|nr:ABC transporter permease [Nitrospirota bacterium]
MKTLSYLFQTAVQNFLREKWINALTILTVTIGLLILSVFTVITLNMDLALKRWAKGFGIVVYLKDNITLEEMELLKGSFKKDPDIIAVNHISKDKAIEELKQIIGNSNPLLEGFEENPLPASFELKLKRESLEPSYIRSKAANIRQLTGVEDVQYGEKWLSSLNSLSQGMKIMAIILGSIIFIATAFVTYSTIKILFYRRQEEIETLKLLGATKSFIRMPFLMEGIFIGLSGGVIGLLALIGLYVFSTSKIIAFIPSMGGEMFSLHPYTYPILPLVGTIMSLTGSIFAVGRIKY